MVGGSGLGKAGGLEEGGPAVIPVVSPAFPEPPTQPSRQGPLCLLTSPRCLDAPCLGSGCGRGRLSVRSRCRWLRSAQLLPAVPLLRLAAGRWGDRTEQAAWFDPHDLVDSSLPSRGPAPRCRPAGGSGLRIPGRHTQPVRGYLVVRGSSLSLSLHPGLLACSASSSQYCVVREMFWVVFEGGFHLDGLLGERL